MAKFTFKQNDNPDIDEPRGMWRWQLQNEKTILAFSGYKFSSKDAAYKEVKLIKASINKFTKVDLS